MLLIYCICWMAEDRFQCAQCREIVKSKTISNKPLYLQLYMYPKKKTFLPSSWISFNFQKSFLSASKRLHNPNYPKIQTSNSSSWWIFQQSKIPRQPKFESWQWLCNRCDGRTGQGRFCVFFMKNLT